jgi:predicted PurR-regulated permease PerM
VSQTAPPIVPAPEGAVQRRRERVSLAVLIGAFVVIFLVAPSVVFLVFAAILIATGLRGGGAWIAHRTGMPELGGLAAFTILLAVLFAGFFVVAAPSLAAQFDELARKIPDALAAIDQKIGEIEWVRRLMEQADGSDVIGNLGASGRKAMLFLLGLVSSAANAFLVVILAIYLAISPGLYRRGFVALLAPSLRPTAGRMLDEANVALRGWMGAQAVSMAVVGLLTWLGYLALGVPLAGILGFLSGLLAFIPNLGPILGAAPAVLLGLSEGTDMAIWVVVVVLVVQTIETYLLTPYVQKEAVHLPPALTIAVQVLFGVLYGTMGLALATPITAAGLRIARIFYVRDYLETRPGDGRR